MRIQFKWVEDVRNFNCSRNAVPYFYTSSFLPVFGSDQCKDFSEEMPLHGGSTLTTYNFDALLLAFFKKHCMSEAAKEDMLKLLELALPTSSHVATSSYMF